MPRPEPDPLAPRTRALTLADEGRFTEAIAELSRALEAAGGPDEVQHFGNRIRHTFVSLWTEQGGNLAALQQILGHASIETTQRYARLSDEAVMREAARIGGNG